MKYLAHVPTEQYGFISVEIEGTHEEAVLAYQEIARVFKNGVGLPPKDFNQFFDAYLSTGSPPENGLELWEQMSDTQRICINEYKKHLARNKK